MERTAVADFYRGKGYQVHDSIVVTGQSGNQLRVPLLCEGPLGNLAVFFGDAGGIDGPEIGAAKRVARDLGATAVVAAAAFTGEQRRTAAELGVVLLDGDAVGAPLPPATPPSSWPGRTPAAVLEDDLAAHPWPASGRPGGVDGAAPALVDIDQLLGPRAEGPRAPAVAAPAPALQRAPVSSPPPAAPSVQAPRAAAPSAEGLWRHARRGEAPAAASASTSPSSSAQVAASPGIAAFGERTATRVKAGRFTWLDLPKAPEAAPDAEYVGTVATRAAPAPAPQVSEEETARLRHEAFAREARRALWIRRGAWTLGGSVAAYLFLLWWF